MRGQVCSAAGSCRGDQRAVQIQLDVVRSEREVDRDADVVDGAGRNCDVRKPALSVALGDAGVTASGINTGTFSK